MAIPSLAPQAHDGGTIDEGHPDHAGQTRQGRRGSHHHLDRHSDGPDECLQAAERHQKHGESDQIGHQAAAAKAGSA